MEAIIFYKTGDPYGAFSNFAAYPITINGKIWPTTEHYFQAQKFPGTDHEEAIRVCNSPMIAARMGRPQQTATGRLGNGQTGNHARSADGEIHSTRRSASNAIGNWFG